MRFSLFSLLALPLALALPSPVSNSSELFSRDQMLTARTNLFNSLGNYGKNNNDKDEVICANIPSAPGSKKYICVCYDLDDDTCYRADSKNPDNVVKDDKLISTVIQQITITANVCYLPKNAKPAFNKGCCAYKCKKGYKNCNNKCIKEHKICSTAAPVNPHSKRLAQREAAASQCSAGFTACSTSAGGFECLDTKRDIESCGGCVNSLGLGIQTFGQDCTSIANSGDVSCISGQCKINTCAPGYKLNAKGDACIFSREARLVSQKYRL